MNHSHDLLAPLHPALQPAPTETHDPLQSLRALLIDEIECGMIVCDGHGVVQLANLAARQELASGRILERVGETLRCIGGAADGLDTALRAAVHKGRRQLIQLSHRGDRLLVSVVPLRPAGSDATYALVVLGRRRPCSDLGLEMLANVYGLTLAERRVLAALMNEASPREIAAANSVALSTVRTQISSIRSKLGTRSVDGLLIRAAEVPPVPSALRLAGSFQGALPAHDRALALPVAA
jgi:DNA-binding CsgD family transcriptional regulator